MVADAETIRQLEEIVRGLAAAGKSLRLYPPNSPMPQQAVNAALAALGRYFDSSQVLSLKVGRTGFEWYGQAIGAGAAGASDLADELRDHGVAELDILPGCAAQDLVSFLTTVARKPDEVRSEGGLGAAMAASGCEAVRVTDVHLTVIEEALLEPEGDVDEFLRSLASDPDKLAAWMAAAAAGDPQAFGEGLAELAQVVGADGLAGLMDAMAQAFVRQDTDAKDALLGLSMDEGTVRELARGMFGHLQTGDISESLCAGLFGQNMLSLSNALTKLPLDEKLAQVYESVQASLANYGHDKKEQYFLSHMMEVRARTEPEPALADADIRYRQVLAATAFNPEELTALKSRTADETAHGAARSVRTMLSLLDQQTDFELYSGTVDNLAAMVPRLIEEGDMALATRVVAELSARQGRATQPWPGLTERLAAALAAALSERSMHALVEALVGRPDLLPAARELIRHAGEPALAALVSQAISHKSDGMRVASELLGRRLLDLLVGIAPSAQWYQLAAIVEPLAREGDPRSMQAVEALLRRTDEQSRREVAAGLAAAGSAASARLLGQLVRDPSAEVAIVAVKALARHGVPGAAGILGQRLGELDVDGKDFAIAREIIGALARVADPAADSVLAGLASRKALIKRGHFAEVQELVRQAIQLRQSPGGVR